MPRSLVVAPNLSAEALNEAARTETNGLVKVRILAIRHLLRGHSIAKTAEQFALGQTQLRMWVRRYNEQGLAGLMDRLRPGRPALLPPDRLEVLRRSLDSDDSSVHLRGEEVRNLLEQDFGARYSLSGTYALLSRLNNTGHTHAERQGHNDHQVGAKARRNRLERATVKG